MIGHDKNGLWQDWGSGGDRALVSASLPGTTVGGSNNLPAEPRNALDALRSSVPSAESSDGEIDPLAGLTDAQIAAAETVAKQLPPALVKAFEDGPDPDADDFVRVGWDEDEVDRVWARVVNKAMRVLATTPSLDRLEDKIEATLTGDEAYAWDTWFATNDFGDEQ